MKYLFLKARSAVQSVFLVVIFTYAMLSTDASGETKPIRIVSLSPSLTEILFAIGAGPQVVAVDSHSNYPLGTPITSLSALEPNMEAIAAFYPDLVLLSYDIGDLVKGLNTIGIETMLLPAAGNFDEIIHQINKLGEKTGKQDQAEKISADMQSRLTYLINIMEGEKSLKVYHEIDENYYSASSSSFIGSIYKRLNMTNIADKADIEGNGYPKLSPEYILLSNPEMMVIPSRDPKYIQKVKNRPGWLTIDAIKKDRLLILDPDIASRWGPRVIEFATEIVKRAGSN